MLLEGNPSLGEIVQLLSRLRLSHTWHQMTQKGRGREPRLARWAAVGVPLTGVFAAVHADDSSPSHPGVIFFDFLNDTAQAQGRRERPQAVQKLPDLEASCPTGAHISSNSS